MDFDQAIDVHQQWRGRLRKCIDGEEKLDPSAVCRDDRCTLGQWINGEGLKFKDNNHFSQLKNDHLQFHRTAAEVVKLANAGKKDEANKMLTTAGAFMQVSARVISDILKLRKEVNKH